MTGRRGRRGEGVRAALLRRVPEAEDALVVGNGAAALLLAVTVLAAGREVVVSRGQLVEIGAGFRLPDLMTTTGARLREVGTTNRTHLRDYTEALGDATGCVVQVHPSNFVVSGFAGTPSTRQLAGLDAPLVVDTGSGLLRDDPALPDEPSVAAALGDGADLVTSSGDKLLGGPQAGLLLGRAELVDSCRRHPLARALRPGKLVLAALEATLRGPAPPVTTARTADPAALRRRCEQLATALDEGLRPEVLPHDGVVGGGGAPGHVLPGWAVALPAELAAPLRAGDPAVVGQVEGGCLLLDLRCVDPGDDPLLVAAVRRAAAHGARAT